MSENNAPSPSGETDIIFDCPRCGKSLCIEESGAGRVVPCPDCGTRMQVPIPERMTRLLKPGMTTIADYTAAQESPAEDSDVLRERVHQLEGTMEEVQARKRELEKLRIDNALRFQRVRDELTLIQSALDRITDILQNATGP
ncbi:MAG: hypothetical protein KBA51_01095 [Kiritimatiellae bacterium]|nr:hypothetical protein [Kiritimatiellia bacterium]